MSIPESRSELVPLQPHDMVPAPIPPGISADTILRISTDLHAGAALYEDQRLHERANEATIAMLSLRREVEQLREQNDLLRSRISQTEAEINFLSTDKLTGFLNRTGLEYKFAMGEVTIGDDDLVGLLDLRVVKYINDTFGHVTGDRFLQHAGQRIRDILTHNIRSSRPRNAVEFERRQHPTNGSDIVCRYGGDEFVLILKNIYPEDRSGLSQRLQALFSVDYALARASISDRPLINSNIPVIASLSTADLQSATALGFLETSSDRFQAFYAAADASHEPFREKQYDEMWTAIKRKIGRPELQKPEDQRIIGGQFYLYCIPQFLDNIRGLS